MNDPAVKLALAMSILLGGFLAAIAFRPDPTTPQSDAPSWSELAALRNRISSERAASKSKQGNAVSNSVQQASGGLSSARRPTVLAPLDNTPPVPELSAKYPGDGLESTTGWGMPILPAAGGAPAEKGLRIHKVVDGDTLAALATRYLGSPNRATEIFQANREVLSDPELLPIGAELKIP